MRRLVTFAAAALFACAAPLCAQSGMEPSKSDKPAKDMKETPALKVGDTAPTLTIDKWVKGQPVTSFEPGKVYVVEFWATWCGPCIGSIPHLTKIQKHYDKGVTIIGVTSSDERGNTLPKVENMVSAKGDVMGYTVAWDKDRATSSAYMEAAGVRGIPTAFVVDQKGKIAYIGHPSGLDFVIKRVVAGNWDYTEGPKALKAAFRERKEIMSGAEDDPKAALKALDAYAVKYPEFAHDLDDMRFGLLMEANDTAEMTKVGGRIVDGLIADKNGPGLNEFYQMYVEKGDSAEAGKLGRRVVDALIAQKDAQALNEFAWTIVDPKGGMRFKDNDLAMKAAVKASEFTNDSDAAILDTVARCYFVKGDNQKAIEWQKRAVAALKPGEDEMRSELESTLRDYEKKSN